MRSGWHSGLGGFICASLVLFCGCPGAREVGHFQEPEADAGIPSDGGRRDAGTDAGEDQPDAGDSDDAGPRDAGHRLSPIGGPCQTTADCARVPAGTICYSEQAARGAGRSAPGGYCTSSTCSQSSPTGSCGDNTTCGPVLSPTSAPNHCEAACGSTTDCREGYACCSGGCMTQPLNLEQGADPCAVPDAGTVTPDAGTISPDAGLPDQCGAAGTWSIECPAHSGGCSTCQELPARSLSITIPPEAAAWGGSWNSASGNTTYTFTPSLCELDMVFKNCDCCPISGSAVIQPNTGTGHGQYGLGCSNAFNYCLCVADYPQNSCTLTRQ